MVTVNPLCLMRSSTEEKLRKLMFVAGFGASTYQLRSSIITATEGLAQPQHLNSSMTDNSSPTNFMIRFSQKVQRICHFLQLGSVLCKLEPYPIIACQVQIILMTRQSLCYFLISQHIYIYIYIYMYLQQGIAVLLVKYVHQ